MGNLKASDVANKIQCFPYTATVKEIKKNTNWREKSCAVVCDEEKQIFGVISESDLLEAEKNENNLASTYGWELCSHKIISAEPDSGIKYVISLMLENSIHHVLVPNMNKNGDEAYNGIISSLDILKVLYKTI